MAQHYRFAYIFLKGFAFQRTSVLKNALWADPAGFLSWLWQHSAEGESAPCPGLSVRTFQHGQRDIALVTLPAPQEPPQAYYVLIAFGQDPPGYYSLEMADTAWGGSGTVLGRWSSEGHYNLGPGAPAPPSAEDFLSQVLPRLQD